MTGKIKKLQVSEGTTISEPSDLSYQTTAEALVNFANDAAYVAAKGSAAEEGDCYYNTTDDVARLYAGGQWTDLGAGEGGYTVNYMGDNYNFEKTADGAVPSGWAMYIDSQSVTFTDAGDLVGLTDHELRTGELISFTVITSTTGISVDTAYYVIYSDANNFQVASSYANAVAGTALPLTTDGTGTIVFSRPVDGTSGSANITILGETTDPLRGTVSAIITKDANCRMGEGASFDFTIDESDKAKMLSISIDYGPSANFEYGTNGAWYDPSDITVWVYDKDQAERIQLAPYAWDGSKVYYGVYQTHATSVNYRLILHVSSVNASAWTCKLDQMIIGPQTKSIGFAGSDWELYEPTNTQGFGTLASSTLAWRRSGDSLYIRGYFTSGTVTATEAQIELPNSLTVGGAGVATTKVGTGNRAYATIGEQITVLTTSGDTYINFGITSDNSTGEDAMVAQNGSAIISSTSRLSFETGPIPITGWSSNTLVSSDADTRVVAANYTSNDGASYASAATVKFEDLVKDTHSVYNTTTGVYTVPVAGWYNIESAIQIVSLPNNAWAYLGVKVDGALHTRGSVVRNGIGSSDDFGVDVTTTIHLNVGQTIEISYNSSNTLSLDTGVGSNHLSIHRLSGPAQITASETVAVRYASSAGQVITDTEIIDFGTEEFDSHSAVTTGASWKFTAPMAGYYSVSPSILVASIGYVNGDSVILGVYKNGSLEGYLDRWESPDAGSTQYVPVNGNILVKMDAGDYIDVRITEERAAGNITLQASTDYVYVSINSISGVI